MNTRVCLGLALCGLLAGVSTGCSTTPMVARGQDALPEPFVRPASYGYQPELGEVVHDAVHNTDVDVYKVPANDPYHPVQVNWHHGPAASTNGTCPPSADCPQCKGHPADGQVCPFCQNGSGGLVHGAFGQVRDHLHGRYPQHRFTYSYCRPDNLQYPPPQVPGGVVVYPYYTLKGPSDFFRDDPKNSR
ncbi:MAG: hypothetical protein U0992_20035 [Planctomycetaceae bacterium]